MPPSARNPPPAPAPSARRRPPRTEHVESDTDDTDSEDLDSSDSEDSTQYSDSEDSNTDTDSDAEAGCRQHVRVSVNCGSGHHVQDSAGNPCLSPTYIDRRTGKMSVSHYADDKDRKLEDHERFCHYFPHHHGTPRKVWCIEDVTVKNGKKGWAVK